MPRRTYPKVVVPKFRGQTVNQMFERYMNECRCAKNWGYNKEQTTRLLTHLLTPDARKFIRDNKALLFHEDASPTNLKRMENLEMANPVRRRVKRA